MSDSAVVPPASGKPSNPRPASELSGGDVGGTIDSASEGAPGIDPVATAPEAPPRTLKSLVLKGSAITIFGFGAGQVLKLVSNLVLTRLLMPEVFGFISLSYTLLEGLAMFSAMGEGPAILRDKRGDDPDFVNTAWTVQVLRGNYLWLAACALAWPMSRLYDEPMLMRLVPVIGVTCLIEGFYSSSILTAKRHMTLGRLTAMTLFAQIAAIITTVSCAYVYRTVWALVAGALVEVSTILILSHTFLPGIPSRFRWEKSALRTLFDLGKWIFLSSMLEFIARQTDRLLLGYYVDMATLGIYAMAFNLSEPFARLNMQMARNVIMPALSRTHRDTPSRMSEVFYKARLGIDAMHLPALGFVAAAGPNIVDLLYDDRYLAAGWMLQVLCLRTAVRCMFEPSSAVCVAFGAPKYVRVSRFFRALMIVIAIPTGWWYGGLHGVVWSTVVAELPALFVLWFGQWKLGVFNPVREMLAFLLMVAGWMAGVWTVWVGTFDLFQRLVHLLKGV